MLDRIAAATMVWNQSFEAAGVDEVAEEVADAAELSLDFEGDALSAPFDVSPADLSELPFEEALGLAEE